MNFERIVSLLKKPNYIVISAWLIPLAVILTILYLNFLPFGYEKTFTINVGTAGDDKGEFFLELNKNLGAMQSVDGKNFRYLDGLAYAVFKPKAVLTNASIDATIEGDGVSFVLPPSLDGVKWDYDFNIKAIEKYFEIKTSEKDIYKFFKNSQSKVAGSGVDFKPNKEFAFELDWTAGKEIELLKGDVSLVQNSKDIVLKFRESEIKYQLPDFFIGKPHTVLVGWSDNVVYLFVDAEQVGKKNLDVSVASLDKLKVDRSSGVDAFRFFEEIKPVLDVRDGCVYLDGNTRLVLPGSADKFEDGAFAIYTEWVPEVATSGQQIIGHFNWEILQDEENIQFRVGRMSTSTGDFYKVSYKIDNSFFNKKHNLLALYNPIKGDNPVGYIEFFVDDVFAGREYFANEKIWEEYGKENLSIGKTNHNSGKYPYFKGTICNAKFTHMNLKSKTENNLNFSSNNTNIKLPIYGIGELKNVEIKITQ